MARGARAVLEAELDDLVAKSQDLRRALVQAERSYRRARRLVGEGASMEEVLSRIGAEKLRIGVSDALDRFEKARHASRRTLVVAGQAEGMSLGQVARLWGFSRQLAARYAAEARATAPTTSPRRPARRS